MKRLSEVCAFLFLLFLTESCTKSGNSSPSTSNNTATTNCSCLVDGKAWSAKAYGSQLNGLTNITGIQSSDGQTITITVTGTTAGTYTLTPGTANGAAYKTDSGASTVSFGSGLDSVPPFGSLVITNIDSVHKTMSGTFNFTAIRGTDMAKRVISNGVFTNISYTSTLPVTNNTCSATVNGNAWSTNTVLAITNSGMLDVSATKNDGSTIGFYLPSTITTGTFTFAPYGTYMAQYNANYSTFYMAQSGTITITSKTSTEMKATFQFSATNAGNSSDVATIANGSFTVKL